MGQYFAAVNTDKKEFVCPWCIGSVAKLWEWAANPSGAIFTMLLRQSDSGGGGDYYDSIGPRPRVIDVQDVENPGSISDIIRKCVAAEGQPISPLPDTVVGRWAGDRVGLVGDYDSSKIWDQLYEMHAYKNISKQVVEAWNDFMDLADMKLKYTPCSSCSTVA